MPARMRSNTAGFKRLRTRTEALLLSDADKAGPLLVEMDRENVRQVTKAYTTEGESSGGFWARLSPGYARWKRVAYPGRKILVRTRETRTRFTSPSNPAHIRRFLRPFSYVFGAFSAVQAAHEYGIGDPGQRLPVRPVMRKTPADLAAFRKALLAFYVKRLRQIYRHA